MSEYRVELDAYNGPLDLLLYLIRRDEIDIYDIPIARVAEQYRHFVEIIQHLDPNIAADFLVMLATLMELKSRALLPHHLAVEDEEEDFEDPRLELVRQLLAYKAYKDAANELGTAAEVQALRFPRQPVDPAIEPGALDLEDLSIWSLMEAFAGLLEQTGRTQHFHEVVYDDTPMALHLADIVDSLQRSGGSQMFRDIFAGRSKAEMIGLFLALLELIRQRRIRVTQDQAFGPITIHLVDSEPEPEPGPGQQDTPRGEAPVGSPAAAAPAEHMQNRRGPQQEQGPGADMDVSEEQDIPGIHDAVRHAEQRALQDAADAASAEVNEENAR